MAKIKKISMGGEVYDCGGDTGIEVTKAQYDQTTPEQRAENIYYVKDEDAFIPPSSDILKATYDALTEAEKKNGTTYFVTDENAEVNASNIKYGDSNVGDTLTELNSTMSGLIKTATETVTTAYYGQVSLSLPESKKLISAKSSNNVLVFPYKAGEYWGLYCSTVTIFPQKLDEGTSITVTYSYID